MSPPPPTPPTCADAAAAGRCTLLLPGDIDSPAGGYRYDRCLLAGLAERGWAVRVLALDATFPQPTPEALAAAEAAVAALPDGSLVIADGLAFGAMPDIAKRHAQRLRWVALVHHPLAMETGLAHGLAQALMRSERRALAAARRVVVTSEATVQTLAALDVPAALVSVIEPGCERPTHLSRPRPTSAESGPRLLCVASVTARKGHQVLLEALAGLAERPWTLHNVGSLTMDPQAADAARAAASRLGLAERVFWHGAAAPADLEHWYAGADLFVQASHFEGYGMALAEALAHGLPAVAADTGAAARLLAGGGGVLVPPGDAPALSEALAPLLRDPARRERLAAAARDTPLPTWEQACDRWAALLRSVRDGVGS